MKRLISVGISLMALVVAGFAMAGEQHQMGGSMPIGSQSDTQEQSSGQHPMRGGGMRGHRMMGQDMMGGQQTDPKAMGRMLQLRGDMLKAIDEVLLKHGKAMTEAN